MGSPENSNWVFDYSLIEDFSVPVGDLPSFDPPPAFTWPSRSFTSPLSLEFDDSFANSDGLKEIDSRKRMRSGSCSMSGTKACKEKIRRDRLNDRFLELSSIVEPGRTPKMDKIVVLNDAVRMISQLREEAEKLKELKESLQEKINELKAEKNDLCDEKKRLKVEKENLERHVNSVCAQPSFLSRPPAIPGALSVPSQVSGKLVPLIGYPGISMWQFMLPASVDTSQDHVLRPPVA